MALLYVKKQVFGNGDGKDQQRAQQHRYSPVGYSDLENGSEADFDGSLQQEKNEHTNQTTDHTSRLDPRVVSDATIGLSDGLTVPFALTAGLSALGSSKFVIIGGLAELIAGSISMGLGGYLGAKSEAEGYENTLAETTELARRSPAHASSMVQQSLSEWELPTELVDAIATHLESSTTRTTNFLMRFHHCMQEQSFEARRAYISALTIALGYFLGGFIPLVPYFFIDQISQALAVSVVVMVFALFAFGYTKTKLVGQTSAVKCFKAGVQMVFLGGMAAAAAVVCVRLASTLGGSEDAPSS